MRAWAIILAAMLSAWSNGRRRRAAALRQQISASALYSRMMDVSSKHAQHRRRVRCV